MKQLEICCQTSTGSIVKEGTVLVLRSVTQRWIQVRYLNVEQITGLAMKQGVERLSCSAVLSKALVSR